MGESARPSRKGIELKPAAVRKRHNIAFRVNDELRSRLQESADAAQRSVSEEIEFRLQRAHDLGALLEDALADKTSAELFKRLASTLKTVRRLAKDRSLGEIETRKALKAAYDHIGEVYFWSGGKLADAPEGHIGSMDAPPVSIRDQPPAVMGYRAAEDSMLWDSVWDRCSFRDDLGDLITDHWSGDGTQTIDAPEPIDPPQPSRSLDQILAEGRQIRKAKRHTDK